MRRHWWKFVLGLGLLGGGGLPNGLPVGLDNQTKHSDAELWAVWKAAQESLAQEVDLNPLQRSSSGAPADIRPGTHGLLKSCLTTLKVSAEPDVTALDRLVATGMERSDPTAMIACPESCHVRYAAAYSFYSRDLTRYAASWEERGDSFSFVLEYEFENQILAALGYSLRWR
jgi:hypothetical protein